MSSNATPSPDRSDILYGCVRVMLWLGVAERLAKTYQDISHFEHSSRLAAGQRFSIAAQTCLIAHRYADKSE